MRSRRSGTIINISSVAGLDAGLACGLYASSKFALEGYTEALSKEVKDFGIDVLLVEPGAFRTNFLNAMTISENGIGEVYEQGPVGQAIERFRSASGKQAGDPEKLVDRIVEYVTGKGDAGALNGKVLRLVLGKDAHSRIVKKIEWLNNDLELGYSVTSSTDL
jgi:NAD(P)-dependent dehydrogenase (short-subunit alcohol dehydrogenase family)